MNITIAYVTSRKNPQFHWFADSLRRELCDDIKRIRLVVVSAGLWETNDRDYFTSKLNGFEDVIITTPKPNVWQGPNRLTKENWFAASNARNTALCHSRDGYLVYADDLSVLMPGWYDSVKQAVRYGYVALGAYQKVKRLEVDNGIVKSYESFPEGEDQRLKYVTENLSKCSGSWFYGCSLAGPVDLFLAVNGWPEDLCDGHGFEDCCMGLVMGNAGADFRFDRRMMTLESEEGHHSEAFRRSDYHYKGDTLIDEGNGGPDDKSHRCIEYANKGTVFKNHFDIRELRQRILNGGTFPVDNLPEKEWYTGIPIGEL